MKKVSYILASLFSLLASASLLAEMIVDIEIKGAKTVEPNVIISTSGLEIGDEFTPMSIKRALEQIYNTKLFEEVRIERENEGGGSKLIIYVQECALISKIEFEGNKKFKSNKLKEICELKENWLSPPSAIFDGKVKITKAYEKEGYYLSEITPEIKEDNNKIRVKYLIDEGKPVKIKSVKLIGNNAVKDEELKRKLKNREKYWWPWSGKFNKEEFEIDPERIVEFYHNNGYPNCSVIKTEIIPEDVWTLQSKQWVHWNKEWITIKIEVDEGGKFYFGDTKFDGNVVFDVKDLARALRFKKYEPYSKSKLAKTMEWIYGMYSDRGYLYLNVDPTENIYSNDALASERSKVGVGEDKYTSRGSRVFKGEGVSPLPLKVVDIVYKLQEGKPARIHKIIIQDNIKTHEKVIRRELTIFPGEIFSRANLITSQRKIFNLGFFKNITLDTRQANPDGDIDLIIKVEEKEAGTASVGASYYPKYGMVGNLSLSAPNFRGQGELFYISLEKGQKMETISLGYTKPWLFDTPLSAGLSLYHTFEGRYWYTMQKTGGQISLTRDIPRLTYTKSRISYTLENVKVRDVKDPVLLPRIPQGLRSAIAFGINRDSRDNFLNPTVGTRNNVEIEFSGGAMGGEVDYHKQVFETSTYHTLGWKFVIGMRGQLGIINGYKSPAEVPLYERFVLGGIGKWGLRGYRDWTVGPISGEEVIGGRFASIFTIEAKIAFPNNIYPLVFFDAGNAWECISEANLQDLKRGTGVGFRIEIPMMGLVGFDLGYRIDPTFAQPKSSWEFHLQMGRSF